MEACRATLGESHTWMGNVREGTEKNGRQFFWGFLINFTAKKLEIVESTEKLLWNIFPFKMSEMAL